MQKKIHSNQFDNVSRCLHMHWMCFDRITLSERQAILFVFSLRCCKMNFSTQEKITYYDKRASAWKTLAMSFVYDCICWRKMWAQIFVVKSCRLNGTFSFRRRIYNNVVTVQHSQRIHTHTHTLYNLCLLLRAMCFVWTCIQLKRWIRKRSANSAKCLVSL